MKYALAIIMALAAGTAHAAEFRVTNDAIQINGQLVFGDDKKFDEVTKHLLPQSTVWLDSKGGDLEMGLNIAARIKEKGWKTAVGPTNVCVSMCALVWLAGHPRYWATDSKIGFHGVYQQGDLKSSASGNAVVGAYLRDFGLSFNDIRWLTYASPDKLEWLTFEKAKRMGIDVVRIDEASKQELFQPNRPAKPMWPGAQTANATAIVGWRCGDVVIDFTSGNFEKPAFTFEIKGLKEPNPKFEWWWPLKQGDDKLTLNGKECETQYRVHPSRMVPPRPAKIDPPPACGPLTKEIIEKLNSFEDLMRYCNSHPLDPAAIK